MKITGWIIKFKILWRSLIVQASWNYERMQGLGFCYSFLPFIDEIEKENASKEEIAKFHLDYFNTHPFFVTFILGGCVHLHTSADGTEHTGITKYKKRMGGALAAIGDELYWGLLKPVSLFIGLFVSFINITTGCLVFLILFNIPRFIIQVRGMDWGFESGLRLHKRINRKRLSPFFRFLNLTGALLSGMLLVWIPAATGLLGRFELILAGLGAILIYIMIKLRVAIPFILILIMLFSIIADLLLNALGLSTGDGVL